jgi:ABC-type microcin C transport system duplicated ATPase subunit YejF
MTNLMMIAEAYQVHGVGMTLRNGVVVEEGATADIFGNPRTGYARALIAGALDRRTLADPALQFKILEP